MSLHTYLERMKLADSLIRRKATGDPASFAKKLQLSKSGTEKFIKEMKQEGFPIYYCRISKSYRYSTPGKMIDKLFFEELDFVEMRKVTGGNNNFDFFSDRNYSRFSKSKFV